MPISDEQRRKCNDIALECFGTAYIFEKRAVSMRRIVKFLTFLGIATPATVGIIIMSFSVNSTKTKDILVFAGIIGVMQLILSIWSLVSGWNNNLAYYLESKSSNYRLANEFSNLGKVTSLSESEFDMKLNILETEDRMRTDIDHRYDISEKDKRLGLRAALRQFQRKCVKCKKIPDLNNPSSCDVCGA